jgi:hypothetical protein
MNIVHPIHDTNVTKIRRALVAALPVVKDDIRSIIEGHCHPETTRRPGSIQSITGHWFNEDTIDQEVLKELKKLRSIEAKIVAAVEILNF